MEGPSQLEVATMTVLAQERSRGETLRTGFERNFQDQMSVWPRQTRQVFPLEQLLEAEMPPQLGWERDALPSTEHVGVHTQAHPYTCTSTPVRMHVHRSTREEGGPGPDRWRGVNSRPEAQPLSVCFHRLRGPEPPCAAEWSLCGQ